MAAGIAPQPDSTLQLMPLVSGDNLRTPLNGARVKKCYFHVLANMQFKLYYTLLQ